MEKLPSDASFKSAEEFASHFENDPKKMKEYVDHLYQIHVSTHPPSESVSQVTDLFTKAVVPESPTSNKITGKLAEDSLPIHKIIEAAEEVLQKNNQSLLDDAIAHKDEAKLRFLLENGANINARDKNGETHLTRAIAKNDTETVNFLAKHGASLEIPNKKEQTPLLLYLKRENYEGAHHLLQLGATLNANNLTWICYLPNGNEVLSLLKEAENRGISLTTLDEKGMNPFLSASISISGNDEVAAYLVSKGCFESIDEEKKKELFSTLLQRGMFKTAQTIIVRHPELVNFVGNDRTTPLENGISKNNADFVKFLLDKQADATVETKDHFSLLHLALKDNVNAKIIDLLASKDPSGITKMDRRGLSAIHYYFISPREGNEKDHQLLRALLDHGLNGLDFIHHLPIEEEKKKQFIEKFKKDPSFMASKEFSDVARESVDKLLALRIRELSSDKVDNKEQACCRKLRESFLPIKEFAGNVAFLQQRARSSLSLRTADPSSDNMNTWLLGHQRIRELALNKKPLTLDILSDLNYSLHTMNGGKLRDDFEASNSSGLKYIPANLVQDELKEFFHWLDDSIKRCEVGEIDPIILSASAFQRFISIHPYTDGNARISGYIMDYILLRFGLPPPTLENADFALFGMLAYQKCTRQEAVEHVRNGVEASYKFLKVPQKAR